MVSSIEDMTLKKRLRAARTACAVMLGTALAGLCGADIAFYVLVIHAFIWLVLLLGKSSQLRELDLDGPTEITDPDRPHLTIVRK